MCENQNQFFIRDKKNIHYDNCVIIGLNNIIVDGKQLFGRKI